MICYKFHFHYISFVFLIVNLMECSGQFTYTKPNILFIIVDDMRYLMDSKIILKNIQNLASAGISFRNAFAQQALCAPSRNSILTGRRPDSLRLYDFYSYWRDFIGNFKTLPELFKENGYDTYSVGKVFHPGISSNFTDDYPYSWTEPPYHPPSETYKNWAVCKDKRTKRLQKNLICPVNVKKQPGATLPDFEIINYAKNILENRTSEKPYFLAVGFHKPHIPLKYPKKYLEQVPLHTVELPRFPDVPDKAPLVSLHPWMDVRSRDDISSLNISFPFGTMPLKWTLKIKQNYFAASLYIDHLIGKLLTCIDKTNTIVILTSDHGWSLGENGLWAKYSNFDVALKVPLVFKIPGIAPNVIHAPVELVDVFPTTVELAGLNANIPQCRNTNDKDLCYDGKSLVNMMTRTFNNGENKYAISQYPRPSEYPTHNSDKPRLKTIKIMGYSIRTQLYRYTEWVHFNSSTFKINWNLSYGGELYDHRKDPDESENVFWERNYVDVKKHLYQLLRTHVDPLYVHDE